MADELAIDFLSRPAECFIQFHAEDEMGIFDKIKNAIWGDDAEAAEQPAITSSSSANADVSTSTSDPALREVAAAGAQPMTPSAETQSTRPTASSSIDIETILDRAAANSGQKLDWRHSIVDLMKALGMDASLAERKELAAELDYRGDEHDSARMNVFLHRALLKKLSENGGKVPPELLD